MSAEKQAVSLSLEERPNDVILHVAGYLDNKSCGELDAFLKTYTDQRGFNFMLDLNCANLEFLTSRAVSVVIYFYDKFQAAGGRFRLTNLSKEVGTVMERLGFGDLDLIEWQ